MSTVAALLALAAAPGRAQTTVDYQDIGGVRYQVTRQEAPTQYLATETVQQQQTTYRQQVTTENVPHQQLYSVPVTQYQIVSRLHGRWNPFVTPYWTHHYEPVTVWQQQVATVQIPVTRVSWAPETRTVQQPVSTWKTANRIVQSFTPVGPASTAVAAASPASSAPSATIAALPAGAAATSTASSSTARPIGGQALPNDPPRQANQWQSPATTSRY
jgi:hypothetical protein